MLTGDSFADSSPKASARCSQATTPIRLEDPREEQTMHRPRSGEIYRAPHLLMKRGFGTFPESAFLPMDATFTHAFYAIAGHEQDAEELRLILGFLNSVVARYWYFMTSSSWGVEREEIQPSEWMTMPIPQPGPVERTAILQAVDDAYSGVPESIWRPSLDSAVATAFELTDFERQLIAEWLSIRWSEFRDGPDSSAYGPPRKEQLDAYCEALRIRLDWLELGSWSVSVIEQGKGLTLVHCRPCDAPPEATLLGLADLTTSGDLGDTGHDNSAMIIVENG